eukprot:ANDGO_02176.mRNA.1 hypothetical protein
MTYALFLQNLFKELTSKGELPRQDGARQLILQDNCAFHKTSIVQSVIPQDVELGYIPAYSPFLDPCEEVFSIWKYYFSRLLTTIIPNSKENLVDLICKSYFEITTKQIQGAWDHTLSFFHDCLCRLPISSRRLLDHIHAGDDKEAAATRKFGEWGLEQRPEVLRGAVEAGVEAEDDVTDDALQGTGHQPPFVSLQDTKSSISGQEKTCQDRQRTGGGEQNHDDDDEK